MRKFIPGVLVASILGAAAIGIAPTDLRAQTRGKGNVPGTKTFADFGEVLDLLRQKPTAFLSWAGVKKKPDPKPCSVKDHNCSITINIIETYNAPDGGKALGCILSVEDFNVDSGVNAITWDLKVIAAPGAASAAGTSAKYQFYPQHEILPVEGNESHVIDESPRPAAQPASGSASSVTRKFHYHKKNDVLKYYPVVVQNYPGDDEVLCGSLDPKIVNN